MKLLLEKLADEIQIGELEERIHARVHEYMDKANHYATEHSYLVS